MKNHFVIFLLSALCATNSYAQCSNAKTLFFCQTTKGKQIEVCDAGQTISYSFGKKGKPELAISVARDAASTFQWAGIGRAESYAIDIPNKNTVYNVFWSVDRLTENHAIEAGVHVLVNKELVATVNCTEKGLINNIQGVNLKASE